MAAPKQREQEELNALPLEPYHPRGDDEEFYVDPYFKTLVDYFWQDGKLEPSEISTPLLCQPSDIALKFIVVVHVVPTLPFYLNALERIGEVIAIIPKSHSDGTTALYLEEKYPDKIKKEITKQFLRECSESDLISRIPSFTSNPDSNEKLIIIDIGGYFAPCLKMLSGNEAARKKILGIIEDTENGLQKYEDEIICAPHRLYTEPDQIPLIRVASVARSHIKEAEDYNVGLSIVRATDTLLREHAHTLLERTESIGVIGFGKIGNSIAQSLKAQGIKAIRVHDTDSRKQTEAETLHFETIKGEEQRRKFLRTSRLLFCATGRKSLEGEDFKWLSDNVYISSCTSADDEFDLTWLRANAKRLPSSDSAQNEAIVTYVLKNGNRINFLCDGGAVNFAYNAVNGPSIYAVQAELVVDAIRLLHSYCSGESNSQPSSPKDSSQFFDCKEVHLPKSRDKYPGLYYLKTSSKDRSDISYFWNTYFSEHPAHPIRLWGTQHMSGAYRLESRQTIAQAIKQSMLQPRKKKRSLTLLTGRFGTGKTDVASDIFYGEDFCHLWRLWFQADNEAVLTSEYRNFGENCFGPGRGIVSRFDSDEKVRKIVKNYLEQHQGWLIVYDGAVKETSLDLFLPREGGHILITSTDEPQHLLTPWDDEQPPIKIEPLKTQEESIELVCKSQPRLSHPTHELSKDESHQFNDFCTSLVSIAFQHSDERDPCQSTQKELCPLVMVTLKSYLYNKILFLKTLHPELTIEHLLRDIGLEVQKTYNKDFLEKIFGIPPRATGNPSPAFEAALGVAKESLTQVDYYRQYCHILELAIHDFSTRQVLVDDNTSHNSVLITDSALWLLQCSRYFSQNLVPKVFLKFFLLGSETAIGRLVDLKAYPIERMEISEQTFNSSLLDTVLDQSLKLLNKFGFLEYDGGDNIRFQPLFIHYIMRQKILNDGIDSVARRCFLMIDLYLQRKLPNSIVTAAIIQRQIVGLLERVLDSITPSPDNVSSPADKQATEHPTETAISLAYSTMTLALRRHSDFFDFSGLTKSYERLMDKLSGMSRRWKDASTQEKLSFLDINLNQCLVYYFECPHKKGYKKLHRKLHEIKAKLFTRILEKKAQREGIADELSLLMAKWTYVASCYYHIRGCSLEEASYDDRIEPDIQKTVALIDNFMGILKRGNQYLDEKKQLALIQLTDNEVIKMIKVTLARLYLSYASSLLESEEIKPESIRCEDNLYKVMSAVTQAQAVFFSASDIPYYLRSAASEAHLLLFRYCSTPSEREKTIEGVTQKLASCQPFIDDSLDIETWLSYQIGLVELEYHTILLNNELGRPHGEERKQVESYLTEVEKKIEGLREIKDRLSIRRLIEKKEWLSIKIKELIEPPSETANANTVSVTPHEAASHSTYLPVREMETSPPSIDRGTTNSVLNRPLVSGDAIRLARLGFFHPPFDRDNPLELRESSPSEHTIKEEPSDLLDTAESRRQSCSEIDTPPPEAKRSRITQLLNR